MKDNENNPRRNVFLLADFEGAELAGGCGVGTAADFLGKFAYGISFAALKIVCSPDINQKGSNITEERLRFDFNFSRKLTDEEVKEVERYYIKKY